MFMGPDAPAATARHALCLIAGWSLLAHGTVANSQSVDVVPTVRSEVTWTNNVDFESSANRKSALIFEVVPGLDIDIKSPRSQLRGTIQAPVIVRSAGSQDGTSIYPQVSLVGRVEAIENFFFIEGTASVSQQYFSPFGARSPSLSNDLDNRYTSQSYRVTPVVQGEIGSLIQYQVSDDNIWTVSNDAPGNTTNSYNNRLNAWIARSPIPLGWRLEYLRDQIDFRQEATEINQVARAYGIWRPDPQVELGLIFGYEQLELQFDKQEEVVYGALIRWRPTPRTSLDANWQHRVGGSSYQLAFSHRTALTTWNLDVSRGISNYPQELLEFPVGTSVPGVLDQLFLARVPDPAERELAVARFMQEQGLATVLAEPFTLFGNQFRMVERARGSVGLLGVRNSVFFNVYYVKTTPISRVDAPIDLPANVATTQYGSGATWTTRLTSLTNFLLSADVVRAESDDGLDRQTDQGFIRANLTTRLSPNTSAFAGVRFQQLRSDVRSNATETAIYAGVFHAFR